MPTPMRPMTLPERRLAELQQISRQRELLDEEQREVLLRAKQLRRNAVRRARYESDPAYRLLRRAQRGRG